MSPVLVSVFSLVLALFWASWKFLSWKNFFFYQNWRKILFLTQFITMLCKGSENGNEFSLKMYMYIYLSFLNSLPILIASFKKSHHSFIRTIHHRQSTDMSVINSVTFCRIPSSSLPIPSYDRHVCRNSVNVTDMSVLFCGYSVAIRLK